MNKSDLPHFFDHSDQPVFIIDVEGQILYHNESCFDLLPNGETGAEVHLFEGEIDFGLLINTIGVNEKEPLPIFIGKKQYEVKCNKVNIDDALCYIVYVSTHSASSKSANDLLNITSDGLFEYNSYNGDLKAPDNFFKVFGYQQDDFGLTYSRWITMIHPQDVPPYLEKFESLLCGEEKENSCEFRVLFKGGKYRWVESNLEAIEYKEGHMPDKIVGNVRDIHEQRQIFEATKVIFKDMAKIRGRVFFRSMAYNISKIIGVKYCVIAAPKDADFCDMKALAFWEDGDHLKDFEYPLAGTPCQHVIGEKNYKIYTNNVDELFPEDTYLSDNGIVSYWGVPFFDSHDEPMGHVFIMDDKPIVEENWIDSVLRLFAASIGTELERNNSRLALKEQKIKAEIQVRQRTRSLEKALVQLDTLFYRSSHDMRAPIATLEGLINILKLENPEINSSLLISMLDGNIMNMKKLNASIGQIGNIRNHQVEASHVHIGNVVNEVLASVKEDYYQKEPGVKIEIEDNLIFDTDEALLKIVLNNVLENAFKFSKGLQAEQPGQIHVSANVREEKLLIMVSDNGIGVSRDGKEQVYEMFFRGSENNDGFGLGLYKTEMALSKIKGVIEMDSTEGRGTEVNIAMSSLAIEKEVEKSF